MGEQILKKIKVHSKIQFINLKFGLKIYSRKLKSCVDFGYSPLHRTPPNGEVQILKKIEMHCKF